ncbi:MAG: hypothetical protein ABGY41_03975 [Candidatus Poribacteria bacterium]
MTAARVAACLFALTLASRAPCAGPFVAYRADDDVTVYDVAAQTHTNLTNHPASEHTPSWSGDGRHIAFASNRTGQWDLYTMRADGTDIRQRTHTLGFEGRTAFSPNGRHIAYTLATDDGGDPIAVVELRTGAETVVTAGEGVGDESVSWFPDSKRILFIRRAQGFGIYEVRVDGAMDEKLHLQSHELALSPDGRRIVHQFNKGGITELHMFDIETGAGNVIPIDLGVGRKPHVPTWVGPDRLLVTDNQGDVYLVNVATGKHKLLPLNTFWVRGFDPAHPRDVSARGKTPFTWGWLKAMGNPMRGATP